MKRFFGMIANWLFYYGTLNAGMASGRGTHETPVPKQLQK